jgi:hypothetical protein
VLTGWFNPLCHSSLTLSKPSVMFISPVLRRSQFPRPGVDCRLGGTGRKPGDDMTSEDDALYQYCLGFLTPWTAPLCTPLSSSRPRCSLSSGNELIFGPPDRASIYLKPKKLELAERGIIPSLCGLVRSVANNRRNARARSHPTLRLRARRAPARHCLFLRV